MSVHRKAINSIRESLTHLRSCRDQYITPIRYGRVLGRISMANLVGLIGPEEANRLLDLAMNASIYARSDVEQQEASYA